jgi:hypothetical protein
MRNGDPEKVPWAFASVTPALRLLKSIEKGPVIGLLLIFMTVTVPLKV